MIIDSDRVRCRWAAFWLVLLAGVAGSSGAVPSGPVLAAAVPQNGELPEAPPDWSYEEKAEFLRTADVDSMEAVGHGVTGSRAMTLSNGRFKHRAHFQTINIFKREAKVGLRTVRNFEDSYRYNIGASRLDHLMGLDLVPVSVERVIGREKGAVTWWIDNAMMTEMDRIDESISPPAPVSWNNQVYRSRVFTQLIQDADPNRGNTVITEDWRLWLIDFTRAFRQFGKLMKTPTLKRIDRDFYNSLVLLNEEEVFAATKPYLTRQEVKALIKRRNRIIEFFVREIERHGEDEVFIEPLRRGGVGGAP